MEPSGEDYNGLVVTSARADDADIRSPGHFLRWLVARQRGRIVAGAILGSLWMVSLALPPYLLGQAIDEGLEARNASALIGWTAALFGTGVVVGVLGIARHRTMTKVRMDASFRVVRATVRHAAVLGATLPRRVTSGEVVSIGIGDVQLMAQSLTVTGPGIGAVIAYVVVAILLLLISPLLAVVVLVGVPLIALTVGPALHRLLHVGMGYREHQGELTARLVDMITGLGVLSSIGGKQAVANRYRRASQALREQGYQVGAVSSWVGALGVGLPALFLAVVTWLAARLAAAGSITIGDLVAVYGYVAMLVVPVSNFIEGGGDIARGLVAARRVVQFLSLRPDHADSPGAIDGPEPGTVLRDPASGVDVRPQALTVLASAQHGDGIDILNRLGRFTESDVTWGGVRLDRISVSQVRDRMLVADNDADLFAGTVRDVVAGRNEPDDGMISAAIEAAVATDIVEALPDGLHSAITTRGANLSGGQRQRLRLARALYAAPEILLAVEPTSAVDANTEALLASRLRVWRQGRTTVLSSTSPLVLDQADVVIFLVQGQAVATGRHSDLLVSEPGYRTLVSRGATEEASW
jgi:ABC-type multidrug transport system fused ATPase/permease subunit